MATNNAINNSSGELTLDPGASGDSFVQLDINTTGEFRFGVDDTDDSFRISQGSALGTNDTLVITADGYVTKPLTPAFLAVLNTTLTNVTGVGSYTIVWDTEVFDQNGDFDGTSTFTAPITGRYNLNAAVMMDDLTASFTQAWLYFSTSNGIYFNNQFNPGAIFDASAQLSITTSALVDMDAADTATVIVRAAGGTAIIDLLSNGSADPYNWFSGYLQC